MWFRRASSNDGRSVLIAVDSGRYTQLKWGSGYFTELVQYAWWTTTHHWYITEITIRQCVRTAALMIPAIILMATHSRRHRAIRWCRHVSCHLNITCTLQAIYYAAEYNGLVCVFLRLLLLTIYKIVAVWCNIFDKLLKSLDGQMTFDLCTRAQLNC